MDKKWNVNRNLRLRPAFTLIELITVIAIITVLMSLLLPAVMAVRESMRRTQCESNLKQLSLSLLSFHDVHKRFPPGADRRNPELSFASWRYQVLPQLEMRNLYSEIESAEIGSRWFSTEYTVLKTPMNVMRCPSDPSVGDGVVFAEKSKQNVAATSYLGVTGTSHLLNDGVLFLNSKVRSNDVVDGISNTLLLGERPLDRQRQYGWMLMGVGQNLTGSLDSHLGVMEEVSHSHYMECSNSPIVFGNRSEPCSVFNFWSQHTVVNMAFCDGHVTGVDRECDKVVLRGLATRAGSEVVSLE